MCLLVIKIFSGKIHSIFAVFAQIIVYIISHPSLSVKAKTLCSQHFLGFFCTESPVCSTPLPIKLSTQQLADASGVALRMVQLYEQRQNDLSKAQVGVVISLAKALGCEVED